jgi:hypothetical protein
MTLTNEQLKYMRDHGLSWRDLYDFPMSWDWWRHYSVYNTSADPGPDRRPDMATGAAPPSPREETSQPGPKDIREEINQLRRGLHYTQKLQQKLQQEHPGKRKRQPLKGVPL